MWSNSTKLSTTHFLKYFYTIPWKSPSGISISLKTSSGWMPFYTIFFTMGFTADEWRKYNFKHFCNQYYLWWLFREMEYIAIHIVETWSYFLTILKRKNLRDIVVTFTELVWTYLCSESKYYKKRFHMVTKIREV